MRKVLYSQQRIAKNATWMMNLKNLQHFIHLAESKSFTVTAQKTHISLSALSRVIQRLEQELEQSLFIRDNRSVELTAAGKELLPVAISIVEQWHQLKIQLSTDQHLLRGKLTLFCSVTASYSHLPQLVTELRQTHPQIEIQLLTGDPAQAIEKVLNDEADIAIAAKPKHLSNKLTFIKFDQVTLTVISPLLVGQSLQPTHQISAQWQTLPFILPESGTARDHSNDWLRDNQIDPTIYAQVAGHEAIVSMVALGCGVGIAPDVVIDNSPMKDRVFKHSDQNIKPLALGLCCKKSRAHEPLLAALMQLCQSQ
ncbi:HTH-type transcriptional activator IlvY [Photobacterium damselae]|uniref:HTH-type transcriptional activator IlvY n=2 Tax=Photobacterium damselae TaxID=38293 RepID=UPI0018A4610B|nr:HTH-type transcriptional activator IlvY [Photobacterium damselae]QOQ70179.1 HTH-type transcriptional activator IlvY [Photobacterium damselae subsp. damselae]